MAELRERIEPFFKAPPDKTLSFVAEMDMGVPEGVPVIYVCPMHPEVVSEEPGSCPKCGMKLLAQAAEETTYVCPMHPEVTSDKPDRCPKCGMKLLAASLVEAGGGDVTSTTTTTGMNPSTTRGMPERATPPPRTTHGHHGAPPSPRRARARSRHARRGSSGKTTWSRSTGKPRPRTCAGSSSIATPAPKTPQIDWTFRVGDQVKLRLVNEMDSDHPMPHPFHVHGAGRFLILARDDVVEPNLVWKDTVLVRTGETVDILLDVTNPGRWMAHCHIAEHHESGMMLSFNVEP